MPLHLALQTLMVKAWKSYTEECHLQHRVPTVCPTIIATLISNPQCVTESKVTQGNSSSTQQTNTMGSHHDQSIFQPDDNGDFDFLVQDTGPMDWNEWDGLLNQFQESLMDDMANFTSL